MDVSAAGHGWYVDPTPYANEEYLELSQHGLLAAADSAAAGQIDLLSVLVHELGHILGFDDDHPGINSSGIMHGSLDNGLRRLPSDADLAILFAEME